MRKRFFIFVVNVDILSTPFYLAAETMYDWFMNFSMLLGSKNLPTEVIARLENHVSFYEVCEKIISFLTSNKNE